MRLDSLGKPPLAQYMNQEPKPIADEKSAAVLSSQVKEAFGVSKEQSPSKDGQDKERLGQILEILAYRRKEKKKKASASRGLMEYTRIKKGTITNTGEKFDVHG